MEKKRSNLIFYLILNIVVSAATTLAVLWVWDNVLGRRSAVPPVSSQVLAQETLQAINLEIAAATQSADSQAAAPSAAPPVPQATAGPTETSLPEDAQVIEVVSVVGTGDLQQEVVLLRRIGEGNLPMVGWKLAGEHNNTYTFPEDPELTLYKDGAVQVYSRTGTDTVTEVYWNRTEAAWRSGELIRLLDPHGNERATFKIP